MINEIANYVKSMDSTGVAALIAAFSSILTLIVSFFLSKQNERRVAHRTTIQAELNSVGGKLYHIVALAKCMIDANDDDEFEKKKLKANQVCQELDKTTRNLRYALWGIDEGLRTMRMLPNYIANLKHHRKERRAKIVLLLATFLRIALDKAIMLSYLNGKVPGIYRRFIVFISYSVLKFYFGTGKPKEEKMLEE